MVTLNLGSGKWLAALLLASLALNIFVGGVYAGRLFNPPQERVAAPRGPSEERPIRRFLTAFTAGLDKADRRTFVAAFAGHEPAMRAAVRAVREARREALARMHATPFDRHALDEALATLRQKQDALQTALQTGIADAVERLPDDARKLVGTPKRRPREERR